MDENPSHKFPETIQIARSERSEEPRNETGLPKTIHTKLNIRFAVAKDLPAIVEIYNQAIRAGFATADLHELSLDDRKSWFEEHAPESYPIYVLKNDEKTVGWGSLSPYRKGRAGLRTTAEISYYIDYHFHGQGFGKKLIAHMMADCGRIKINNLVAFLLEKNGKSIKTLEHFGFIKWGHLPGIVQTHDGFCAHQIYGKHLPA